MADFDPSKLSKKELQDLFGELEKIGALTSNVVDDERSIRDTILDQTKQLKFQQTLKRDILRATNKLYDIQYNLRNEYDRELGTRQASLAIDKQITQIEKSNRSLTQDIVDLRKQDTRFSHELANSLQAQVEQGLQYKKILKDQQDTSEQIRKNIGVQGFQGLSELLQKIGGKASQLAGPFEDAAEAAREIAQENVEGNKKIKEREQILEKIKKIKSGELKATKKNLEGIEVTGKKGQKLYGEAARNALKSGKAVTDVGKAMSKGQMAMKSFGAGIKAFGPLLKKALGPIGIVLMVVDAIKFFVGAMFQASKEIAELGRGFGISEEAAKSIRDDTFITANTVETTNKSLEKTHILQSDILKAYNDVNKALGTTLNLNTELGGVGKDILSNTAALTSIMGVSAEAQMAINRQSIRTGELASDITKEVFGTVRAQNLLNNTQIDEQEILEQVAKTSKEIQAIFGFNTAEIAKAVYQAKKLGFEFSDLTSAASNLMDFEGSISKELEAELILGRNINLEKARAAALNNDLVGVGKELRAQNIDIVKLQKENRIAAESAAAAMGMTVEQAVKAQEEFEVQDQIQKRLNARFKDRVEITVNGQKQLLSATKLQEMALGDIQQAMLKIGVTEQELTEILGEQVYQNKLNEDAAAQFRKNMDKLKEAFASLVEGGVLDDLADILTGITKSALFQSFAQAGSKKRRAEEARENAETSGISNQQLEALENAKYEQGAAGATTKVAGMAAAGAAIGSIIPGVGTLIGAGVGALIGGSMAAISELMEKDSEKLANEVARDLELEEIGGYGSSNNIDVQDFTIRTHPKDTLVMAGGTKLGDDSKETNQLLRTLITAVENGGNVYLNNQLVGEISNQQQLNSFRAGS